jgi:hypothetical protein
MEYTIRQLAGITDEQYNALCKKHPTLKEYEILYLFEEIELAHEQALKLN